MVLSIDLRAIQMQIEITVVGWQFHDLLEFYEFFAFPSVRDQALDRANAQSMFVAELHQLWKTRHGDVGVKKLADHPRLLEACHSRQIHSSLGVTRAPQHTTVFSA